MLETPGASQGSTLSAYGESETAPVLLCAFPVHRARVAVLTALVQVAGQ